MADEDQVVEGLLTRSGRLPPGCKRLDGGCVAEGGRLSLSWSWNPSCAPQESWEVREVLFRAVHRRREGPSVVLRVWIGRFI